MKKIILYILGMVVIFLSSKTILAGTCDKSTLKTLNKHLPQPLPPGSKIISQKKVSGLCETIVEFRGRDIPFYSTKDFVIVGQMFKNKKNLPADTLSGLVKNSFLKNRKKLDKLSIFTYSPPHTKIKHTIYMFTDPVCPYCHKAIQNIKNLAKLTNSEIKIVLFAVHIPQGDTEINKVICSNMDINTYISTNFPLKKQIKPCNKAQKIIKATSKLAHELKVSAVPTFFLDDGTKITGANIARIKNAIERIDSEKK